MRKYFPEIEKEQFNVTLPIDLAAKIRERGGERRWSLTRTVTEIVATGLGIDPAEYGIEPQESVR